MESDNTFNLASNPTKMGPGEKQIQQAKTTNDASKGWQPPTNRVQRSSSIRYQFYASHNFHNWPN